MKRTPLTVGEMLTIQFSLGYLLILFLLVNQSPSPGMGRGDERVNPATPGNLIAPGDAKSLIHTFTYRTTGRA